MEPECLTAANLLLLEILDLTGAPHVPLLLLLFLLLFLNDAGPPDLVLTVVVEVGPDYQVA